MKLKDEQRLAQLVEEIEQRLSEIQKLPLTLDGPTGQGFFFTHNLKRTTAGETILAVGPELLHNLLVAAAGAAGKKSEGIGEAIAQAGMRLMFEATQKAKR